MSQIFNDGNVDLEWRRGAVVTATEEGLWTPRCGASEEDIQHLQSRFLVFRCAAAVGATRDVTPCPAHLARWVRDLSAAHDARLALQPVLPLASQPAPPRAQTAAEAVQGMDCLVQEAQVPREAAEALLAELVELGAVNVRELPAGEWASLAAWSLLRPLER